MRGGDVGSLDVDCIQATEQTVVDMGHILGDNAGRVLLGDIPRAKGRGDERERGIGPVHDVLRKETLLGIENVNTKRGDYEKRM